MPAFLVLVVAELLVPIVAERSSMTPWHPRHIAERYGLFTLIVLGESVLSATFAVQSAFDTGHDRAPLSLAGAGVVITVALPVAMFLLVGWVLHVCRHQRGPVVAAYRPRPSWSWARHSRRPRCISPPRCWPRSCSPRRWSDVDRHVPAPRPVPRPEGGPQDRRGRPRGSPRTGDLTTSVSDRGP